MKKWRTIMVLLCAVILCQSFLAGCRLAQENTEVETSDNKELNASVMVVGVLITKEPLETSEKIYAKAVTETDEDGNVGDSFSFEGLDGYATFYQYEGENYLTRATGGGDEDYFFDIKATTDVKDKETTDTYEVSCYVDEAYLEKCDDKVVFVNPIYQDTDGKIYTQAAEYGTYVGQSDTQGELFVSESYSAQITVESEEGKKELATKAIVHIGVNRAEEQMNLAVYNKKDELLERKEIEIANAPETLKVSKDADYIIVNYIKDGKETDKKLIDLKSEEDKEDFEINYFWGESDSLLLKNNIIEIKKK